jgi:hypothetical protein
VVADVLHGDKVDEAVIVRNRSTAGGQLQQLQQYHDIATGGLIREVTTTIYRADGSDELVSGSSRVTIRCCPAKPK